MIMVAISMITVMITETVMTMSMVITILMGMTYQ